MEQKCEGIENGCWCPACCELHVSMTEEEGAEEDWYA